MNIKWSDSMGSYGGGCKVSGRQRSPEVTLRPECPEEPPLRQAREGRPRQHAEASMECSELGRAVGQEFGVGPGL